MVGIQVLREPMAGAPSLRACSTLTTRGPPRFAERRAAIRSTTSRYCAADGCFARGEGVGTLGRAVWWGEAAGNCHLTGWLVAGALTPYYHNRLDNMAALTPVGLTGPQA